MMKPHTPRLLPVLALVLAVSPALSATTAPPDGGSSQSAASSTAAATGAAPAQPVSAPLAAPATTPAAGAAAAPPVSAEAERRLRALSDELRCLVCQNQTLADSNADLAVDLRNQVHDLIASGRSDDQIKSYLVERYGDFVLYRPPVQRNTLLLWFGPFVLLIGGVLIWWLVQRRSGASRTPAHARAATPAQSEDAALRRARALLDE